MMRFSVSCGCWRVRIAARIFVVFAHLMSTRVREQGIRRQDDVVCRPSACHSNLCPAVKRVRGCVLCTICAMLGRAAGAGMPCTSISRYNFNAVINLLLHCPVGGDLKYSGHGVYRSTVPTSTFPLRTAETYHSSITTTRLPSYFFMCRALCFSPFVLGQANHWRTEEETPDRRSANFPLNFAIFALLGKNAELESTGGIGAGCRREVVCTAGAQQLHRFNLLYALEVPRCTVGVWYRQTRTNRVFVETRHLSCGL